MIDTAHVSRLYNDLGAHAEPLLRALRSALESSDVGDVMSALSLLSLAPKKEEHVGRATMIVSRTASEESAPRYHFEAALGQGGMGEVTRVYDRNMERSVVQKTMLPGRSPERFLREARLTARLQHPAIVPAYEIGLRENGQPYYTMPEVHGRTLAAVVREVHAVSTGGDWGGTNQGWSLRRLVDAFHRVCEAVAYAHSQGVIHRDIKPHNVMVGDFGQVFLMDWGLAKDLRGQDRVADTDSVDLEAVGTRSGAVLGTPSYMAPEQAAGAGGRVGFPTDLYGLGATLYEILSGHPPYSSGDPSEILAGPPAAVAERAAHLPLPSELVRLVEACMAPEPERRPLTAAELAREVGAWLDGARRRDQALEAVRLADSMRPEIADLQRRAQQLQIEAEEALKEVKSWEPEDIKAPHWAREDEAKAFRQQAEIMELKYLQALRSALNHVSDLPEAHQRLAEHYRGEHGIAEVQGDEDAATKAEVLLREHDRSGRYAKYLKGTGALTLLTDPPGAEVLLYRYVPHNRRLVERFERSLGVTPLIEVEIEQGSYLLRIRSLGCQDIRYPVSIGREEHWDGIRPGDSKPYPIVLPVLGSLREHDVYVPAGWFKSGGDYNDLTSLPGRRVWADAFIIRRFPITNEEYIGFLNALVDNNEIENALEYAPQERRDGAGRALLYGRDSLGHFILQPDDDGDLWLPDYPVVNITQRSAVAYASWMASKERAPWRLPGELEWEKAARGVDGRFFPWGDHFDPTWCCMRDSHAERLLPAVVQSYVADESPYGVRGMGGNTRDWCSNAYRPDGPRFETGSAIVIEDVITPTEQSSWVFRGGSWASVANCARASYRDFDYSGHRANGIGFRIVRSFS